MRRAAPRQQHCPHAATREYAQLVVGTRAPDAHVALDHEPRRYHARHHVTRMDRHAGLEVDCRHDVGKRRANLTVLNHEFELCDARLLLRDVRRSCRQTCPRALGQRTCTGRFLTRDERDVPATQIHALLRRATRSRSDAKCAAAAALSASAAFNRASVTAGSSSNARERDALALAAGQRRAGRDHGRVVLRRHARAALVHAGTTRRYADARQRQLWIGERDVGANRGADDVRLLSDRAEL
jgi:hypothetical protein